MNEITISNTSLPTVCALDSRTAPEPFFHADRTLDFHVLIYVLSGAIYVTEEGTDYALEEGELFFLKAGLHHWGRYEIPKGTSWVFVHFYTAPAEQLQLPPDPSDIGIYEPLRGSRTLPKELRGLKGTDLEARLLSLAELARSSNDQKRFLLNFALGDILARAALFDRSEPTLPDRIARYLEQHRTQPFSSKALEQHFFLSYKRLAALFKAEKGCSMQSLHDRLRLRTAAELLRTTGLSVGQVAERTGFTDQLYFSRCFKKHFGLSPREYRRSMSTNY